VTVPAVLVLGIDPHAIPGIDADTVRAGLDAELARFAALGIDAGMTLLDFGESTEDTVIAVLAQRHWDVVVVGGGIRKPEALLDLFERIVNLIRRGAPQAAIAFNASGGDSLEAARRWL
jgi:nucleotide-binding universal stress UspA family protein